jgi:hypothetical protein
VVPRPSATTLSSAEGKKPPAPHPIGGPREVSVMKVEGDFKYSVNRAQVAALNNNIDYEVENI